MLAFVLSYNAICMSVSGNCLCTLSARYFGLDGYHGGRFLVAGLCYIVLCFTVTAVCHYLLPVIKQGNISFLIFSGCRLCY